MKHSTLRERVVEGAWDYQKIEGPTISVVYLDATYGPSDLSTYYAGRSVNPDRWVEASKRIFSADLFVLGPVGSGLGWIEFTLLGGWRGRLIDKALIAELKEGFKRDVTGMSEQTKNAFARFTEARMGMVAGTVTGGTAQLLSRRAPF